MLKAVAAAVPPPEHHGDDRSNSRSQSPSAARRRKLATQRRKVPENYAEMARRRFLGREWKTLGEVEKAQLRAVRAKEGIKCEVCGAVGYYKETCANDCAIKEAIMKATQDDSDSDEERGRTPKKTASRNDTTRSPARSAQSGKGRSPSRDKAGNHHQVASSSPTQGNLHRPVSASNTTLKASKVLFTEPANDDEPTLVAAASTAPLAIVWTDPNEKATVHTNNASDTTSGNLRERMYEEQIFLRESDKPIRPYQFFAEAEDGYNRNLAEMTLHQVLRFSMRVLLERAKKREALLSTSLDADATLFHPSKISDVETRPFFSKEIENIPEYKEYLYKATHPPEKVDRAYMFRMHMMPEDALDDAMRGGDIKAMKKLYQPSTGKLLSIHSKDGWKSVLAKHDLLASSSTKKQEQMEKNTKALTSQSWVKSQAADMKRITDSHLHIIDILKSEIENEHDRERRMLEIPFHDKKALNRMSKKLWKERLAAADRIHRTLKLYDMKIGGSEEADYLMFCLDEWIKTATHGESSYWSERNGLASQGGVSGSFADLGVSDGKKEDKSATGAKTVKMHSEPKQSSEKQGVLESFEKYFCGKETQQLEPNEDNPKVALAEPQRRMLEAYDFTTAMEYKRKAESNEKRFREEARRSREKKQRRSSRVFSALDLLKHPSIPAIESRPQTASSRPGTSGSRGVATLNKRQDKSKAAAPLPPIISASALNSSELKSNTRRELAEQRLRKKILEISSPQQGDLDTSIRVASELMTSTAAACAEDLLKSLHMDDASAKQQADALYTSGDDVNKCGEQHTQTVAAVSKAKDGVDKRSLEYQRNLDKIKYNELKTKFAHVGLEKNMRSGHFSDTTKRTPAVIPIHRVIAYDPPQLQIKSPLANSIVFNQMQNITNPATGFAEPHYATLFSRATLFETNGTTPGGDVRFEDTAANRGYSYLLGRSMANLEKHAIIDPYGTRLAKKSSTVMSKAQEAKKQARLDEKLMMMRGVYGFH